MADITVEIGGRSFDVACQSGEEPYLRRAAKIFDDEAMTVVEQLGRMPAERMLLLAGLMLADRIAQAEASPKLAEELAEKLNALGQRAEDIEAALTAWHERRRSAQPKAATGENA